MNARAAVVGVEICRWVRIGHGQVAYTLSARGTLISWLEGRVVASGMTEAQADGWMWRHAAGSFRKIGGTVAQGANA